MERNTLSGASAIEPTAATPAAGPLPEASAIGPIVSSDPYPPTLVQPVVASPEPVMYVDPAVVPPVEAVPMAPVPVRPDWGPALMAAFVALLIGATAGFLLGRASNSGEATDRGVTGATLDTTATGATADQAAVDRRIDDVLTLLLAQAQQEGHVVLPTPYPKLDQLLALSTATADTSATQAADTQATIDGLTAERDDLQSQVTALEQQVTTLQEQLAAAQTAADGSAAAQQKAAADAATIADLQAQLNTTKNALSTANTQLQTTQRDLATATATLQQLNVQALPDLVGLDIADVRKVAKTNGWQIIERPVSDATVAANAVTKQLPAANQQMITGSVLYVEFAQRA